MVSVTLLFCAIAFLSTAQVMQVVYEESTLQSEEALKDLEPWMRKIMEERESSHRWQLLYHQGISLYKAEQKSEVSETINQFYEKYQVYYDMLQGEVVKVSPMLNADYLVSIPAEEMTPRWQLSDEHKQIGNYQCQRARMVREDSVVVFAWYTPAIPVQSGPNMYFGLPGLILQIERKNLNTTTTITALSVTYQDDTAMIPARPDTGKPIDYAAFQKISEKHLNSVQLLADPFDN